MCACRSNVLQALLEPCSCRSGSPCHGSHSAAALFLLFMVSELNTWNARTEFRLQPPLSHQFVQCGFSCPPHPVTELDWCSSLVSRVHLLHLMSSDRWHAKCTVRALSLDTTSAARKERGRHSKKKKKL